MKNRRKHIVLVTGGCGFIGSHVVDRLIEENYAVVVLDDLSTGTMGNLNQDAIFYQGDVSDKYFVNKIFESVYSPISGREKYIVFDRIPE